MEIIILVELMFVELMFVELMFVELMFVELMFNVHFIKGVMYRFVEVLQTLNEELDTETYTIATATVKEINIDSRYQRADGLKVNVYIEKYDRIIRNADFLHAIASLIKNEYHSNKVYY